jgi:hypothetical protein
VLTDFLQKKKKVLTDSPNYYPSSSIVKEGLRFAYFPRNTPLLSGTLAGGKRIKVNPRSSPEGKKKTICQEWRKKREKESISRERRACIGEGGGLL